MGKACPIEKEHEQLLFSANEPGLSGVGPAVGGRAWGAVQDAREEESWVVEDFVGRQWSVSGRFKF